MQGMTAQGIAPKAMVIYFISFVYPVSDTPSTKGVKRGTKGKEKLNKKGRTAFGKARQELVEQHKEAQENSGKEHNEMMAYFEKADKRVEESNAK